MIDRAQFFRRARVALFGGLLKQGQVDGVEAIFNEWESRFADKDLRWLAYALGTAHHETDATMQPIEEYDKGGARLYAKCDAETGCAYYGRGLVQLTWRQNYQKAGDALGLDLVHHPEIACQLVPAAKILLHGMAAGWFTGARFDWYFRADHEDWYNARRIINGLDRANLVAGYAKTYFEALTV